jgi:small subunit ribosomal protein S17
MVKKKNEETEETGASTGENQEAEAVGVEAADGETAAPAETAEVESSAAPAEETVDAEAAPADESVAAEAASAQDQPKQTPATKQTDAGSSDGAVAKQAVHKRAEKVGIVASDKMMKTVTVRVDRLVKHPVYRKYIKKRKKFMAHDDLGAQIGDKVKIVETRPLSARKRWRVVEIIQKAQS